MPLVKVHSPKGIHPDDHGVTFTVDSTTDNGRIPFPIDADLELHLDVGSGAVYRYGSVALAKGVAEQEVTFVGSQLLRGGEHIAFTLSYRSPSSTVWTIDPSSDSSLATGDEDGACEE